jgi:hypothetical protein
MITNGNYGSQAFRNRRYLKVLSHHSVEIPTNKTKNFGENIHVSARFRTGCLCHGQSTRCGPPAWEFCVRLTTRHKRQLVTKYYTIPRIWSEYLKRRKQRKIDA